MKTLNQFINEKFRFGKNNMAEYSCQPKNKEELKKILRERLKEDKNADLNDIDVSNIVSMFQLFYRLDPHNIDISDWDVSNVEDMGGMFLGCEIFNSDLSNWDVSNVTNMSAMFYDCKRFEGKGLENWDVSMVEDMLGIFYGCKSLKNMPSWYKK